MRRIHVRWEGCLELGLVTLLLGCGVGAPAGGASDTGRPTADNGPRTPTAPTRPGDPPGTTAACYVTADVELGTEEAASPAVAFGAGRFATAWTAEDGRVHVALVDASGAERGARVLAGGGASEPAVAALSPGGFLIVWRERGVVRGERLAADGSSSGGPFTIAPTTGSDPKPTAASAGGRTVVAWADQSGLNAAQLEGSTLSSRAAIPGASDPGLAPSGDAVALVFSTGARLGHARVAFPVQRIEPDLFRDAPGKANLPRASATGDGGLYVTWEDDRGGDGNESVYLTRLGADGRPAGEITVPGEAGSANYPDVATTGGRAAVVYYQFRDGPPAVYLTLLGPDLHRVGGELCVSGKKPARHPRVAYGDGALGIAYTLRDGPAHLAVVRCR
jgi:hypothetical protein